MVFAGPSGNGKTYLAQEIAETLNGPNSEAFIKVDCGKIQLSTEIFGLSRAYQRAHEGVEHLCCMNVY
jgi:ATP-dependent Clp protease ATP-binding subunit ClpA